MKAMPSEEFAKVVMGECSPISPFAPIAEYDPDGDCLEFFIEPDPFYAERIDDLVTVYLSEETGEIVGSLIKGIRGLIRKWPGFVVEIENGKVHLKHIFLAALWTSDRGRERMPVIRYRELIKAAEETDVEAEVGMALA